MAALMAVLAVAENKLIMTVSAVHPLRVCLGGGGREVLFQRVARGAWAACSFKWHARGRWMTGGVFFCRPGDKANKMHPKRGRASTPSQLSERRTSPTTWIPATRRTRRPGQRSSASEGFWQRGRPLGYFIFSLIGFKRTIFRSIFQRV